ncbi:DUF6326 family protein [Deinococcus roseus]|uniref:DoxX family protein n=1 Tax=Deinococcus roseus TaxID=392414 RepID=A0ABQ2DCE8_9DEIO|nr:DUF6326 family protein [Deinococcus roseus]GGJ51884.1 hypothetical protein GCM10008938_42390 [Deinococcus roseus]
MKPIERQTVLSTLWIFAILNYLYADVLGLMDGPLLKQYLSGTINGITVTPGFLFLSGVLMEIAIVMVPVSRLVPAGPWNRWLNVGAALIHTLAVAGSLFVGPKAYYVFFASIEIMTTLAILVLAWSWKTAPSMPHNQPSALNT